MSADIVSQTRLFMALETHNVLNTPVSLPITRCRITDTRSSLTSLRFYAYEEILDEIILDVFKIDCKFEISGGIKMYVESTQ